MLFLIVGASTLADAQLCYQFTVNRNDSGSRPIIPATFVVKITQLPQPMVTIDPTTGRGSAVYSISNLPSPDGNTGALRIGSRLWGSSLQPGSITTSSDPYGSGTVFTVDASGTAGVTVQGTLPTSWSGNNYAPPTSFSPGSSFKLAYSTSRGPQAGNATVDSAIVGCSEVQSLTGKPDPNDFTGNGFSYPNIWRPSGGVWYGLPSSTSPTSQFWGVPGDVPVPADYDGDGKSDYAIWRPSQGTWWVIYSSTGQLVVTQWGEAGDIPITGSDFDGDGKADYAIWRPSEGAWWVILSSTNGQVVTQWGAAGDIPISAADFDRDGITDYVVWRPSSGEWWVIRSSTSQPSVFPFGQTGDIPLSGDYDGDGKTDYAYYRPSEGNWYVLSTYTSELKVTAWGQPGDIPIQGDFTGDGVADYVVYRPSSGTWWINYADYSLYDINPPYAVSWGEPGDLPIGQVIMSAPPAQ
jgi:hypothetical protein